MYLHYLRRWQRWKAGTCYQLKAAAVRPWSAANWQPMSSFISVMKYGKGVSENLMPKPLSVVTIIYEFPCVCAVLGQKHHGNTYDLLYGELSLIIVKPGVDHWEKRRDHKQSSFVQRVSLFISEILHSYVSAFNFFFTECLPVLWCSTLGYRIDTGVSQICYFARAAPVYAGTSNIWTHSKNGNRRRDNSGVTVT